MMKIESSPLSPFEDHTKHDDCLELQIYNFLKGMWEITKKRDDCMKFYKTFRFLASPLYGHSIRYKHSISSARVAYTFQRW